MVPKLPKGYMEIHERRSELSEINDIQVHGSLFLYERIAETV